DEVVEPFRAEHERGHDLAAVALLGVAGHGTRLDEIDDGGGEHLRVDAKILLLAQEERGRRWDRADTQLQRRPIGDEVGDICTDPPLDVADRAEWMLVRWSVDLDREVDLLDVDEALAQRPRHRAIELHDHRLRGTDGRVDGLYRCAE